MALGGEEDDDCVEETDEGEWGDVADEMFLVVVFAKEGVER